MGAGAERRYRVFAAHQASETIARSGLGVRLERDAWKERVASLERDLERAKRSLALNRILLTETRQALAKEVEESRKYMRLFVKFKKRWEYVSAMLRMFSPDQVNQARADLALDRGDCDGVGSSGGS